jgi:Domain of unknown function (DUF222)/HNH endonuclease
VFQGLTTAVETLGAVDVERLPVRELGDRLVAFRQLIDRQEAEFSRWLACFDRRHGYRSDGSTSSVAWLRTRCGLSGGGAAQRVEVARELPKIEGATDFFKDGTMSLDNAGVLARTAAEIGDKATALASRTLVDAATRLTPEELRTVGRRLRHTADPEGELAAELRKHERRRLRITDAPDGMIILDGLLDSEGGALVRAAIEPLCKPLPDDARNPDQRRSDGLVELARQRLQAGTLPSSGGVRPHLLITAVHPNGSGGTAGDSAELIGVGPIPATTFERLTCDAAVTTTEVDSNGEPLSVGRTRRSTPAPMRRALVNRDRGCAWPGCDRPPEWTDSHHIRHWTRDHGPTETENLVLLCRAHHRLAHEGGWKLALANGKLSAEPP